MTGSFIPEAAQASGYRGEIEAEAGAKGVCARVLLLDSDGNLCIDLEAKQTKVYLVCRGKKTFRFHPVITW